LVISRPPFRPLDEFRRLASSLGGHHWLPWSPDRLSPIFRELTMLYWALLFFVISVIAGLFGFTNVAAGTAMVARFFFAVFLLLFLALVILSLLAVA
jgi:uncharacterized membrane protein YtjA (UPF0391 family)